MTVQVVSITAGEAERRRARKLARLEAARAPALRLADRLVRDGEIRRGRTRNPSRTDRKRARLISRTPVTGRDLGVELGAAVIDDPFAPGEKIEAAVNRRVDILADELARKRISKAAFMTGREIQAVFERAASLGMPARDWMGGDRVDAAAAHEKTIIKSIDAAEAVKREMVRLTAAVGEVGARFLREIVADGVSFSAYAERRGRGGERGTAYVADRFRAMLEELTEFRAARGRG